MMVSYVTPELYMPSGEVSFSKVVEIAGGVVNRIYPFAGEVAGMLYIPSIHLSNRPGLKTAGELSVTVSSFQSFVSHVSRTYAQHVRLMGQAF